MEAPSRCQEDLRQKLEQLRLRAPQKSLVLLSFTLYLSSMYSDAVCCATGMVSGLFKNLKKSPFEAWPDWYLQYSRLVNQRRAISKYYIGLPHIVSAASYY